VAPAEPAEEPAGPAAEPALSAAEPALSAAEAAPPPAQETAPPPAQETAPPPAQEAAPPPAQEAEPARPRRRAAIAVAAVAVLLLAFGTTMTVLYARESSARAARDRAVAARDAQLAALRGQLSQLEAQGADLQTKLKAAQDKQLDPAAYELVKLCVQTYAKQEEVIAKILADPNAFKYLPKDSGATVFVGGPTDFSSPTICSKAAKFLK
jgi:hypothetical protein